MSADIGVHRRTGDCPGADRDRAWPAGYRVGQRVAHVDVGAGARDVEAVGRVLCGARIGVGGCHGRSVVGVGDGQDVRVSS